MTRTDDSLLDALRTNDRTAFIEVYDLYFPVLAHYVLKHGGSKQDAEDLFQESLIVLLHRLAKSDFTLSSSLKTFLYAINKNLWLKHLRSQKPQEELMDYEALLVEEDFSRVQEYRVLEQEKKNWLQSAIGKISNHCVVLITEIFFRNRQPEVLIQALGYRNAHSYNTQKYKCLTQLRKEGKKMMQNG